MAWLHAGMAPPGSIANLDDVGDVDASSPSIGDLLSWDGSNWVPTSPAGGSSVPTGVITMWYGLVSAVPAGWNLCDGTNGTPDLRGRFIKGAAVDADVGVSGGAASANYTPTGLNSAPTFTGNADTTSSDSAGTPAGTLDAISAGTPAGTLSSDSAGTPSGSINAVSAGTPAGTLDSVSGGTPAGSISADSAGTPAGSNSVPTFTGTLASLTHSGTAVADHASHTHTYTQVPNHTHPHNIQGGTTAAVSGTNVLGSTATGGSIRAMAIATSNPTGGVATATTNNENAALTHSVTQPSAHSYTPQGSVTAPTFTGSALGTHSHTFSGSALAGHTHTFTGSALGTHSHTFTGNALATHSHTFTGSALGTHVHTFTGSALAAHDHAFLPTGSVSAPVFTGDAAVIATEPEYYTLAYIMKL